MKELNNSQHKLYIQAIKNPSVLSEDDLLQLIVRYPYSQPLIFAYERRKRQLGEMSENKSLALLYAPSSSWLWSFVNSDQEEEINVADTLGEEPVFFEVVEDEFVEVLSFEEGVISEEVVEEEESEQDKADQAELDALVSQGSMLVDYFVFDEKSSLQVDTALVKVSNENPENISLYNDELMPYSFRWWLHKTRLEYADTYQPFAIPSINKPNTSVIDFGKLDEAILDQQIKEHIIHFQDPEAKLSEQVKNRPLSQTPPKKTDTIIESFIRKDPIIQAPTAESLNNENMARQSAEDNFVLVTETLAVIYKDQGLYQKAIEVFQKLILKYPEKKSYFATQIKELEKNL